jgi:cyanophycinase
MAWQCDDSVIRAKRGTKSVPTLAIAVLALLGVSAAAAQAPPAPKGHLVVVGGGGVPDVVLQRALQLAGGPAAPVVVLPQASELADTGEVASEMWRKAGATNVRWLNLRDLAADRKAVDEAALIWFPGGDQNNLTKALEGTPLPEAIRARHAAGAVVGGTSAGAAVMSHLMITGDADLQSITVGATKTAPGFALWPDAIVDQHFLKRQRHSRLVSLVLEHPALVGVGIDERTAAILSDGRLEVVGESTVVIYDARKAVIEPRAAGQRSAARHVTMHVLTAGMEWDSRR